MKTLILAGGQGDRLNPLTDNCPKALVKVHGKELIRYTLDLLSHFALKEVGLIAGYQSERLTPFLKKNYPAIQIFETPHFNQGSILGIQCALPFLGDDFLLMNADHIYPNRLFKSFLEKLRGITIACDFDRPLVEDDMKIERDAKGHLKTIHKKLTKYDGGYIGMTFCPGNKISTYLSAQETTLAKLGPKASVEMILGELASSGEKIDTADVSGTRWLEIDTLADLNLAETTLRQESNFLA